MHSADGRPVGRRHVVAGLTTVVIYQRDAIRYAVTGHTLFIAPGSITDPLPNSPTQGTSLHCIR